MITLLEGLGSASLSDSMIHGGQQVHVAVVYMFFFRFVQAWTGTERCFTTPDYQGNQAYFICQAYFQEILSHKGGLNHSDLIGPSQVRFQAELHLRINQAATSGSGK